jgi:hypothetical protein
MERILKISLKRGRKREPLLHWSFFTLISWVHFDIHPSTKKGISSHLLMISHAILGFIFSGTNMKFLSISKTSKL